MIYVSSACLKKERISEVITQLAENEIRNIELSGGTNYYADLEKDLISLKGKYNLTYVFHAYFPPPQEDFVVNLAACNNDIYRKSIDFYKRNINLMKKLGSKVLSVHAGFLVEVNQSQIGKSICTNVIYDKQEGIERFCKAYRYLSRFAAKEGITLYLENNVIDAQNFRNFQGENYLLMTDYNSFFDLYQKMKFNLLLDLGHLYVSCHTLGLDYMEQIKCFEKYIKWLHISENNGYVDEHTGLSNAGCVIQGLKNVIKKELNITLEAKGNVEEIKESYKILEKVVNGV